MFGDFMALPMDAIVNQAAKYWFLSNEQASAPLVVRSAVGGGGRFGAIHSQNPATWFQSISGLKIACPAFPADAKQLLKAAIRDDNPVLFLEHKGLYSLKGDDLAEADVPPLEGLRVVREGSDVTLVSIMKGVHEALAAAELLAADGIDAEVLDLRCLRPLDPRRLGAWTARRRDRGRPRGARRRRGADHHRRAVPLLADARGRLRPGRDEHRRAHH
jgi:acetoin:2,6-dichlorophenolindophenol oxidoreductase subunit beta